MKKFLKRFKIRENVSKGERLIYVIILLWVAFGIMGLLHQTNLTQLAGYYASLTLFISTYLWGEWRRTSQSTNLLEKGRNSSREVVIYLTVILWTIAGVFGIIYLDDINPLTVYFSALSPFVMSYIIYKTSKGNDLPIFNGDSKTLVDKAINAADITKVKTPTVANTITTSSEPTLKTTTEIINITEPKDNENFSGYTPESDNINVEDV